MPVDTELIETLRSVIKEELKPVRQEIAQVRDDLQEQIAQVRDDLQGQINQARDEFGGHFAVINKRLDNLEEGQKKMQKDITDIKRELRCVWEDIGKLDKRLTAQEERAVR